MMESCTLKTASLLQQIRGTEFSRHIIMSGKKRIKNFPQKESNSSLLTK